MTYVDHIFTYYTLLIRLNSQEVFFVLICSELCDVAVDSDQSVKIVQQASNAIVSLIITAYISHLSD